MTRIVSWIKANPLTAILVVVVLYLLTKPSLSPLTNRNVMLGSLKTRSSVMPPVSGEVTNESFGMTSDAMMPAPEEAPPTKTVENRMVVEESYLSLLVKDVVAVKDQIIDRAQSLGGYMVTANVNNPTDQPSATVIVRIPSDKLKETLDYLRTLSIRVVSENLDGQDVTDSYVDIEKHIAILETAKAKFQSILDRASEISDITNLTQQILNQQRQIDSLKGQQEAMKKRAQLAKITLYLSTDEISLPYAPSEAWRPNVIFKLAVRALVSDLRGLGTKLIWAIVYSVIWIPIAVVAYFVWKFVSKHKQQSIPPRKQVN